MTSIKEIEGIGPKYAAMLAEGGVRTTEQLLEAGDTATKRMRLADETHLGQDQILGWVHQADLCRINGIGEEFAELLVRAGVVTVPKLAYRSASSLYADLAAYNEAHHVVRRLPAETELEKMILQAKKLPKLIRH
jgi:predicted flap endonuclease-1-like 5' DNA nuclease